ncbi:hypothetical protein [Enterocloster lavalensis]|jgi:hypothetical protein|uniref:hypothetical protein n=1 Tax=Enterocloster lavalensis TaxID=460384 RepID=UPI0034A48949
MTILRIVAIILQYRAEKNMGIYAHIAENKLNGIMMIPTFAKLTFGGMIEIHKEN